MDEKKEKSSWKCSKCWEIFSDRSKIYNDFDETNFWCRKCFGYLLLLYDIVKHHYINYPNFHISSFKKLLSLIDKTDSEWIQISSKDDLPKTEIFLSIWKNKVCLTEYCKHYSKFRIMFKPLNNSQSLFIDEQDEYMFTHYMKIPYSKYTD